jgi:hypothetical protein
MAVGVSTPVFSVPPPFAASLRSAPQDERRLIFQSFGTVSDVSSDLPLSLPRRSTAVTE